MSVIENNPYSTAFQTAFAPEAGAMAMSPGAALPAFGAPANDQILPFFGSPGATPAGQAQGPAQQAQGPWASGADGSGALGFAGLIGGLISSLQTVLSNVYDQMGFGGGTSTAAPNGESFVRNATASSVGDPHEKFDATTGSGQNLVDKWDNMQSHGDLLDSDSFAGGYRVSNTVTQPNSKGVTMNASASVALDGGASNVTMNADGSFSVSSSGANVQLQAGQTMRLGDGATVSLGTDGALTVSDTDAAGGTMSTKLVSNGHGGVNISSSAKDVDLGGYLATRSDGPSGVVPLSTTAPAISPPMTALPIQATYDPYTLASPNGAANATAPVLAETGESWNSAAWTDADGAQLQVN